MRYIKTSAVLIISLVMFALSGCGGGSDSASTTTSPTTTASTFPSGVSADSPTALTTSSGAVSASLPWQRRFTDWMYALQESINTRDGVAFKKVVFAAMPLAQAKAAPAKLPAGSIMADYISTVSLGTTIPTAANLDLNAFFGSYISANCYGPSIAYSLHDNSLATPKASGTLPSGDLGMWLAREGDQTTGTPCSAAELNALLSPVKKRINSTMIFGARMNALAVAGAGLPASGSSVDLTTSVNTFFQTLLPTGVIGSVTNASISNAAGIYTYLVESSSSKAGITFTVIVKVVHDGALANFNGVASYLTSKSNDNCTNYSSAAGKIAQIGTLRYSKSSSTVIDISSREAPYCTAGTLSSTFSNFADLSSVGELNPATYASASNKGWSDAAGFGGFKRFGATYDPSTFAGNFKFAWQAGNGDSNSRMFAMNIAYNSTTETRTGKAFFGFSGAMNDTTTTATDLLGMICNWAGPENSHSIKNYYQYQQTSLSASATDWDFSSPLATSNKITYAPINSCGPSSATMGFEDRAPINGVILPGEGNNVANGLDTLDVGKLTVQSTIVGRGFTNPTLY